MNCPRCGHTLDAARMLGRERWKNSTKQERTDAARNAALARWAKKKNLTPKKP